MLINFDVTSDPYVPQQKFKGGKWSDRLHAKRSIQRRQEYAGNDSPGESVRKNGVDSANVDASALEADFAIEQPPKRIKTSKPNLSGRPGGALRRSDRAKDGKPRQVVSSLFSFNPGAKTIQQSTETDAQAAAPSNAPLSPELQNFTSLGLSATIAEHLLNKMEIKGPTAVQREAVAQLLKEDVDAFIQAETGSGKTLAYLLPIVQKLFAISVDPAHGNTRSEGGLHRNSGLFAIVLAPTRELSKQISVVLETLLRCAHWIVATTVSGGEKKKSEKARLRKGVNILIATPGRLADHLEHTEVLDVSTVRWLVLDEGDRLMELGFEKDIQKILSKLDETSKRSNQVNGLPEKRVTMLCSATMKTDVQKLGELSLKDAVHIRGSTAKSDEKVDGAAKTSTEFHAPAQLQQSFAVIPAKLRLVTLVALLKRTFSRRGSVMKTLVFMSCSDSVDFHYEALSTNAGKVVPDSDTQSDAQNTSAKAAALSSKQNQVQVFRLHGSLPQAVRTSTLARYRQCKDPAVLVCTDVASRGLDLPNVDFVIEYDPPFSSDDHLHRIGRTARAGKHGRAMIFLLPGSEEGYIDILKSERAEGARHPVQHGTDELLRKGFTVAGIDGDKGWEDRATEWQLDVERWALENPRVLERARRAYQGHIRAYATHVAVERSMFDMTQLHLGHLAKAFGLRDKPGSIGVPGLRPSKNDANANRADRKASAGKASRGANRDDSDQLQAYFDVSDGKQRMQAKMRQQAGLSEFNLG